MPNSNDQEKKQIVLIGPPNSGKTSLFNWLTGFQNKTMNYPGSTVVLSSGWLLKKYNLPISVIDAPGIYSLFPKSEEEEVTLDCLFKKKKNFCYFSFRFNKAGNTASFIFST